MSDHAQFEAMLEALINEDQETAKAIFHNIVVGKSREIYEELLESDFNFEKDDEDEEDFEDEDDSEEDADEESEDEDDSEEDDDFEFDDEESEEGDLEDRVVDLEDELEALRAEFEEMLHDEENEEESYPGIHDDEEEFDMDGEFGDDELDQEPSDESDDEFQKFMEYVNKVNLPKHGDDGVNNSSPIEGLAKDFLRGDGFDNIAPGGTADNKGTKGGLADPTPKPISSEKYQNVEGGVKKAGYNKSVKAGHGAEKKGATEKQVNTKSPLKGR